MKIFIKVIIFSIIKVWDLRKSYRNVKIFGEPLPRMRYYHKQKPKTIFVGFMDMITNPQLTRLYASGVNNMVYSYALDSTESSINIYFINNFNNNKC
jgi:hypothetical protein